MNSFDILFGADLDFQAFSSDPNYRPSPVDTRENLALLSKLQSSRDVSDLHVRIGAELTGKTKLERSLEGDILREKGNALYSQGNYEEALKVYEEAIHINPFDSRLFTNAGICMLALGKNEETIAICGIASDVGTQNTKSYLLCAKARCNLGYIELAKQELNHCAERLPYGEVRFCFDEIEQLCKKVPKQQRRKTDSRDWAETERRLLSSGERSPSVYTYLVQHLLESTEGIDEICEKCIPIYIQCLTKTPWISDLVKDPSRVAELEAPGEYRLISSFLVALQLPSEDRFSVCQKVVDEPCFIPFMVNLSRALVRKYTLQTVYLRCGPGYALSSFFASYVYLLATLLKYPSIRSEIFKTTPPFNDLAFYAQLFSLYPGIFDTADSPDTNMFVESITAMITESWFLDKLEENLDRMDYVFSLLATVGTIFLQNRSPYYRLEKPPYASFLPFWLKVSSRPRTGEIMARRPGIWLHLSSRLRYATKELDHFVAHLHHRDHLQDTLRVLNKVAQFLPAENVSSIVDEYSRDRLIESFTAVLNFRDKCPNQLAAFAEQNAKFVVKLLTKLSQVAPQSFAKGFLSAKNNQPNLVSIASLASTGKSAETSSAAIECFSVLIKHATSSQVAQLTGKKEVFSDYVAKLVSMLAPPTTDDRKKKEDEHQVLLSEQVIEILSSLLGNATDKENALVHILTTLKPAAFLEALARSVQKHGAGEKCGEPSVHKALNLVAGLVALDKVFEDASKSLNKELAKSMTIALQTAIDGANSEEEKSSLNHLASVLNK